MDILCLLHDGDEYGVIRWPLEDIARAAGVPLKLATELSDKGVLKGGDGGTDPFIFTARHAGKDGPPVTLIPATTGPCWYCSRMVRDEHTRQARGKSTRFGGDEQQPKPPIGGGFGGGIGYGSTSPSPSPSTSPSTSTSPSPSTSPDDEKSETWFEAFWKEYPSNKRSLKLKAEAERLFWDTVKDGEEETAMRGLKAFKRTETWRRDDGQYAKNIIEFLTDEVWRTPPPNPPYKSCL